MILDPIINRAKHDSYFNSHLLITFDLISSLLIVLFPILPDDREPPNINQENSLDFFCYYFLYFFFQF